MSRILNRQRQLAEAGRLRLGYTQEYQKDGTTKSRPVRSETWIMTSHSEEVVAASAALWGGTPERWQPLGNGAEQWRVITTAKAIDAILPPGDPLTQAYETWSKGGAQRRCDGATEQFSGSPCLCIAAFGDAWYEQPKGKVCDTKTRLKVLLPDLPGLGSYRVETGSFYAADEIAGVVDFIRSAVGEQTLVPVRLRIEPRTRVANGETKQFVVPVVELRGVTTGQVLAGADLMAQVGAAPRQAQIVARPVDLEAEAVYYTQEAEAATYIEQVRDVYRRASSAGHMTDSLAATLKTIGDRLNVAPLNVAPGSAEDVASSAAWEDVLRAGGEHGWGLADLEDTWAAQNGGMHVSDATAAQLTAYAAWLRAGVAEAGAA